jgi:hypothetical protein
LGKSCASPGRHQNRAASNSLKGFGNKFEKMKKETTFYIGWNSDQPREATRMVGRSLWLLAIGLPILAVLLAIGQRSFSTSVFEFGELTTLEGVLSKDPVPHLKMTYPVSGPQGNSIQSVLLVGFGKKGAGPVLDTWNQSHPLLGQSLVEIRGTLIYHDGKALMELTESTEALLAVKEAPASPVTHPRIPLGRQVLKGEIMDAKCYFGVMKPGEGKPHKSCAARCISGGVPPVLKAKDISGKTQYFLLLDQNGAPVNQEVLPYVGERVQVCGDVDQQDDWLILLLNQDAGIQRLGNSLDVPMPMCGN